MLGHGGGDLLGGVAGKHDHALVVGTLLEDGGEISSRSFFQSGLQTLLDELDETWIFFGPGFLVLGMILPWFRPAFPLPFHRIRPRSLVT